MRKREVQRGTERKIGREVARGRGEEDLGRDELEKGRDGLRWGKREENIEGIGKER